MFHIVKSIFRLINRTPITVGFLIFGLTVSMLIISFATSFVAELLNMEQSKMKTAPPNAFAFTLRLHSQERVLIEDYINIFKNLDKNTGLFFNTLLFNIDNSGVDEYYPSSIEWFNKDIGWHYPISQGKYYTTKDIQRGAKVVLIGKNLNNFVKNKNGTKFIKIFGEEYKVVGMVGFKDKKSTWDSRVFMPLTSLPKISLQDIEGGSSTIVIYNSKGMTQDEIRNLLNKSKEKYRSAEVLDIKKIENEDIIGKVAENTDILLIVGILCYVISIIYSVNIVSFWLEQRRFEIGVRKAFGYTNIKIAGLIVKEMFGLAILSFVISMLIQFVFEIFINDIAGYPLKLYIENIIVGLVTVIITAVFTSIWPVIKSLTVQPVEAMKL